MPSGPQHTVDPDLIARYRAMASEETQFLGLTVKQYEADIGRLVRKTQSRDLLDYGSGWGRAWPEMKENLQVTVQCYDPAIPKYQRRPGRQFDGVVCVDVLEHIPEHMVDDVLDDVFWYAQRFVFITTCSRPAKKFFPNTDINLHCTVKPYHWWWERISAAKAKSKYNLTVLHKDTV
jgi:hypothetical protein